MATHTSSLSTASRFSSFALVQSSRQVIAASETNLRTLVEQAPVAIAILRGPDLRIDE